MSETRFTLFAILYACAVFLDHLQMTTAFEPGWGALAAGTALLALFSPWSTGALVLVFVAQAGFFVVEMPDVPNLGFVHLVFALTALTGLIVACIRRRSVRVSGIDWLTTFAPALRLEAVIVYAWAFWHKVNWGFLDPEHTCAIGLWEQAREVIGSQFNRPHFLALLPGEKVVWPLIVGTLAVEGGLPVLLVLRRTRNLGIAVALCFHIVLGFGYFYAFSAAATAMLLLFAPDELVDRIARRWSVDSPRDRRRYRTLVAVAVSGVLCALLVYGWRPGLTFLQNVDALEYAVNRFGQYLFPLYIPVYAWAVFSLFSPNLMRPRELLFASTPVLWLFPIATALNGAFPYLGLKNEYSFAMYSNLRTEEGRTNHLVMPLVELAGYQRDIARVVESSDPSLDTLARNRLSVPFQELHRRVQKRLSAAYPDFSLTYERNGKPFVVPSVAADPVLGARLGLVAKKLLGFREIPPVYHACCH